MIKVRDYKYTILFVLFLVGYYAFYIQRIYGFALFPDEFGYWTYAAKVQGYDWSNINSLGSYYSYGYSLILLPVFSLFKDAVICYRAAVTLNFILLILMFFLTKYLFSELEVSLSENELALYSAMVVLLPSWLFYSKMTLVEVVIAFFYTLNIVLVYRFLYYQKALDIIAAVIVTIYLHFLHMRCVGTAVALVLTLVVYLIKSKKINIKVFLVLIFGILAFAVGMLLKKYIQTSIFSDSSIEQVNINDYLGQISKLKYIASTEGLKDFAKSLLGKILYVSVASFGLAPIGMYSCVKRIKEKIFYLFVILAAIGQILICAIYLIHPSNIDELLYGRYCDLVVPMLMMIGLLELRNKSHNIIKLFCVLGMNGLFTYLSYLIIKEKELSDIRGYMLVGLSGYANKYSDSVEMFILKFVIGSSLIIVALFISGYIKKEIIRQNFYLLIILAEIILSMTATSWYFDRFAKAAYRDTYISEIIGGELVAHPDKTVVYVDNGEIPYIAIIQFMMRDRVIRVVQDISELTENDIVVIFYNDENKEKLIKKYKTNLVYGHFGLFYS